MPWESRQMILKQRLVLKCSSPGVLHKEGTYPRRSSVHSHPGLCRGKRPPACSPRNVSLVTQAREASDQGQGEMMEVSWAPADHDLCAYVTYM